MLGSTRLLLFTLAASSVSALKLPTTPSKATATTRREALANFAAVASVFAAASPALAKSKASIQPNKVEGVGANAGATLKKEFKAEYAAMAGDKGSRGVASKEFEKSDTVQYNRKNNGGLARDANGRKIVTSDRVRDPAELGLKQWDGN